MKREVAHNLVIILVLVVTMGFIFMNSNLKFTGNVALTEYNQSNCTAKGYEWTNLTECDECVVCEVDCVNICEEGCITEDACIVDCETACSENTECISSCPENCVPGGENNICEVDCVPEENLCVEGCVNQEDICAEDYVPTCTEEDTDCEESCVIDSEEINVCEVDCVPEENLCVEGCQDVCEDCVEKWGCTGDCSLSHLELCNETTCDGLGYWYDANDDGTSTCNEDECLTDGHCDSGYECNSGTCVEECEPSTCSELSYDCGSVDDGCGTTLECGNCQDGYDCNSGKCEKEEDKEIHSTTVISKNPVNKCVPEWTCTEWSKCLDGKQERTCTDTKNCDSEEGMPDISQSCVIKENCFDGMKNQDEQGIDCGGVCEKQCSVFTIVGGVINGPIESSKEFFLENKTRSFVLLTVFIILIGGIIALKVFWKQIEKKINFVEIKSRFNKLANKFLHKSDNNLKVN